MKWLVLLIPCFLVSCAAHKSVVPDKSVVRNSPAVWLNGAEVRSEVKAMKGEGALDKPKVAYRAGTSQLDGPFFWSFTAEGTEGEHLSMIVEGVQISTGKTRRNVQIPQSMVGQEVAFSLEQLEKPKRSFFKKPEKEDEEAKKPKWLASYALPSSLQLYPKVDGKIVVAAKIRITTAERSDSEWVNFALLPSRNKNGTFSFRRTMIEYGGVPIE